ncbi:MAG TPA: Asp23/Gls24 family envelope stress response protein [Anaerolineaceae bacterium]|nr:Asp23/Gls24 family envelope stress response protein [Anaerolineaceae bacterium]HPC06899.1 Asp23/Gls24 family envelope stress response protein [Anaerolineaceae bacterium]
MSSSKRPPGKTTIAPDVLTQITRLTTLNVEGVADLASIPTSVDRLFLKNANEGVLVEVTENLVNVEIHILVKKDVNIRDVCHEIQSQVSRAISEMVGMEIGKINIHVEDVVY